MAVELLETFASGPSESPTISDLLTKYGSDKNTYHSYGNVYNQILSPYKETCKNLLELGVLNGSSLRVWRDYFKNATIIGFDNINTVYEDRIYTILGDQKNINKDLVDKVKTLSFDIIIDDCTHEPEDQISSFILLKELLVPGGIYIIEDVKTAEIAAAIKTLFAKHADVYDLTENRNCPDNRLVVYNDPR